MGCISSHDLVGQSPNVDSKTSISREAQTKNCEETLTLSRQTQGVCIIISSEMPHSTTGSAAQDTSPVVTKTIDGIEIPIYPLETIDYGLILRHDTKEHERLLKACQYPGFFHLDFQNDASKQIHDDLYAVYDLEKKYFAEHEDPRKMKDIEVYLDMAHPMAINRLTRACADQA